MNWTPHTPQRAAWAFLVASVLALFLSSSTTAVAQDQDDLEIVGFEAETLGDAINFVARTRSGKPIPPDRITLKTRRNIVRITYVNIPLAVDLGRRIDFNTEQLPHVTKGYAQRENRHQAIVRLKFDTRAEQVIKGHVVAPAKGGTAILLPFGDLGVAARFRMEHLPPDAQEAESKPTPETNPEVLALIDIGGGDDQPKTTPESAPNNNNDEETTPKAGYMPSVPGIDEAEANAAKAEDKPAKTPYKPILPPGQALKQAQAAKSASADDAPLQLADADALPSMSRVAGTFLILGLLLMALMFGLRRLQERNPNRLAFGRDSVKVLATYPIARGHSIIFIDILNEIAVLSQSPNAINILYRLDEHQVEALRKQSASSSRSSSDSFVQTLASRFIGQAPTPPDTVPIRATVDRQSPSNEATRATRDAAIGHEPRLETLDDLARSLEANARAGAARRSQELEALTEEPEPTPTSRSLRRTAAAAPPPPASRPVAVDTDLYAAIEQPTAAAGRTDHSPGYREPGPGYRDHGPYHRDINRAPWEERVLPLHDPELQTMNFEPRRAYAAPTRPYGSTTTMQPIQTDTRDATLNAEDEPIDFAAHLSRIGQSQPSQNSRVQSLRPLHNREAPSSRPAIHDRLESSLDEEDILEATRAYRNRIRSLGRL